MKTQFTFIDHNSVLTEIPLTRYEYLIDREADRTQIVGEDVAPLVLSGLQLIVIFFSILIVLGLIAHHGFPARRKS